MKWRIGSPFFIAALTAVLIAAAIAALLASAGFDVQSAAAAAFRGALGSRDSFLSATLVRASPLMLCGLAVTLAFRAGVLNVGAEGQLLGGAIAAITVLAVFPLVGIPGLLLALVAAAFGGALAAGVPALLRFRFGVLEVVSTIMMNFVALHTVGYLVRGPLQEPTRVFPQSASIVESVRLPILVPESRLHWGFALAVVGAVVMWWFLRSTASGFRLRVLGANAHAAEVAGGVAVGRLGFKAFLASGAIAGLAGGTEVAGVTFALYENLSPGYGYTAIAVALMAGLHPLGVVATAIFFGGLAAAGSSMQREAAVPSVVVSVVEALVILAVLLVRVLYQRRVAWAAGFR